MARIFRLRGLLRSTGIVLSSGVALVCIAVTSARADRQAVPDDPRSFSAADAPISERISAVRAALAAKAKAVRQPGWHLSQWYNFGNYRRPVDQGSDVPAGQV